jgi:phosphatidylglycerophosphatase C
MTSRAPSASRPDVNQTDVNQTDVNQNLEATPDRSVVAAFDFDGTLTRGGSVWQFLVNLAGRSRVARAGLRDLPELIVAAVAGGKANDVAKQALFTAILAGRDNQTVARQANEFGLLHFRRRVRPEILDRLRWHVVRGHRVVIVSASLELYLSGVAKELGVDGLICTQMQVGSDGKLTGRFEGPNCRGAEKARRLREWIDDSVSSADKDAFVWAYGNSAGDLDMLRGADLGVNVGRLGRFGKLKGFAKFRDLETERA